MFARTIRLLATVILLVGLIGAVGVGCPLDAIATHSSFVGGAAGSMAVETCVTRSGSEDTYTYTLTDLSVRTPGFCSFAVAGIGALRTVAQTSPPRWAGHEIPAGSCASWWVWSTIGFHPTLPAPRGLLPGASVAFSITVEAPSTPAEVSAQLLTCNGKPVTTTVLGPSACPDILSSGYEATCACSASGCTTINLFEGDGSRIQVIGGPDTQTIPRCEPSWLRHGFLGSELSSSDVAFRLWIDGVSVPLVQTEMCTPGDEPGGSVMAIMWHVQFPADHFDVGLHEVVGEWEALDTPDTDPFVWRRMITLEVVPCAIPLPELDPALPDISVSLVRDDCSCGLIPPQQYVCELEVIVNVRNDGTEPTGLFHISLAADQHGTRKLVPSLQPGQDRRVTLELGFEVSKPGGEPNPSYEVAADCLNRVNESNEENNTIEGNVGCP
ncbi:hypothetical protein JW848_11300 [Candidatus Bipolaricaulota bacterium]|nr:hypothetical protein [Candidatus Bipolaricaulota bacterium]